MKLLIYSTDRNILEEGSEAHNRMREYSMLGIDMHIILPVRGGIEGDRRFGESLTIHPIAFRFRIFSFATAYRRGRELVARWKREGTDILVSTQDPFETGLIAYRVAKKEHVALQLQVHTDVFNPQFAQESFVNRIRVRIAAFLFPRARRIRVVSERVRRSLVVRDGRLVDRIFVLPIFVDVMNIKKSVVAADLHVPSGTQAPMILMASRITQEKDFPLAILAMRELVKTFPDLLLVIVGNGPELSHIRSLVRTFRLESHVRFEPWRDSPISYYRNADLFLLTSRYEGYGRTVIEALAAGLPVVMTDVGVAGEIVRDGISGMVAPVGDCPALVRSITAFLKDESLRSRLRENGRRAILTFPDKATYLKEWKHVMTRI